MKYNCEKCNDTGSRDKSGDYLDCGHCDAAMQRAAMNDFLDKLPAMGDYDAAWLVHQRALAMAPKQEAHEPAPEIRTVLRDSLASGLTMTYGCSRVWSAWGVGTMTEDDFYPADECDELLDELCDLAIAALRPDLAAPAAANGALTDEQIIAICEKECGWLAGAKDEELVKFARAILAAAGPDAALVKALEKIARWHGEFPDVPNGDGTTSSYAVAYGSNGQRDYMRQVALGALSGAKGN